MGSYYIFAHPEKASNYRLLLRLHKIDPPQRFEITAAPRGEFLKPGQLLERFGSMTVSEIRRTNENLLRNFLRNYHQNRELVPYAVGTYRVVGTLPLAAHSFCRPGLTALLQAVEQPEIILEQPFTCDDANLPALTRSLTPGQEIKLEKPLDLSAVIHIERLEANRLLLTTMPLLYGSYGSAKGGTSFSLEPPEAINLDAGLPLLSQEQIGLLSGETWQGGQARSRPAPQQNRRGRGDPHSRTTRDQGPSGQTGRSGPRTGRRPRHPGEYPGSTARHPRFHPRRTARRRGDPGDALCGGTLPQVPVPVVSPGITPAPPAITTGKPVAATTPAPLPAAPVATNQPPGAPPSEVWPVYAPGQMPRGRLVEPSDTRDLAARGIGGSATISGDASA